MSLIKALLIITITALTSQFAQASCSQFDQGLMEVNIPVVVRGKVIQSKSLTGLWEPSNFSDKSFKKKNHTFVFKITESKKGYMRVGDKITFNYSVSQVACPSTQTPQAGESWLLNIKEVNRENEATPYGTVCGMLGSKL